MQGWDGGKEIQTEVCNRLAMKDASNRTKFIRLYSSGNVWLPEYSAVSGNLTTTKTVASGTTHINTYFSTSIKLYKIHDRLFLRIDRMIKLNLPHSGSVYSF